MNFLLQWLYHNDVHSCGFIQSTDARFRSWTLGDPPRDIKISKTTRFKAGYYELKINKIDTPLTIRHREAYNKDGVWFKYHIEVTGIPGFKSCYVHSGIEAAHTDGCVLLMYIFDMVKNQGAMSLAAVKDFYRLVYPLLENGTRCYLEVRDEADKPK